MFSRLFQTRPASRQSRAPDGCVIWAVGDIHGRADLSGPLLGAIRRDLAGSDFARKVIVLLGDYVDRGADSRTVLDQVSALCGEPGLEVHCLRGNHEDRMEAFLDDPSLGPGWCDYGGLETLHSYGVSPPTMRGDAEGWIAASRTLKAALPSHHRDLLRRQVHSVSIGDYFFCHAGAKPGVRLEEQSPDDLMWIRGAFLEHRGVFDKVVVHGHTPSEAIVSDSRRIGVDTGAYATNVLSAVRLVQDKRAALQVRGRGSSVEFMTSALNA